MTILDFSRLDSLESISRSFGVSADYILSVIKNPTNYYTELRIPKKGRNRGKYRIVYKAEDKLAHLHSEISTHIQHNVYTKEKVVKSPYISSFAYGFIKKKGTLHNARIHLNKRLLLTLDIKNFF